MADIVDSRRKDYSVSNRQKYMERERVTIRKAVRRKLSDASIKDLASGKDVDLDMDRSTKEIDINYSTDKGHYETISTGNDKLRVGDKQAMPWRNGGRGREGDLSEDGEANFNFRVTAEEFLDIFFDDLALPFQVKKTLLEADSTNLRRAGFVTDGSPARLSVIRTYKNSLGRTMAERQDYLAQLEKLQPEEEEEKRLELGS